MYHYPADIYTEPEPDVDTLANLGPLTRMVPRLMIELELPSVLIALELVPVTTILPSLITVPDAETKSPWLVSAPSVMVRPASALGCPALTSRTVRLIFAPAYPRWRNVILAASRESAKARGATTTSSSSTSCAERSCPKPTV